MYSSNIITPGMMPRGGIVLVEKSQWLLTGPSACCSGDSI